MAAGSGVAHKAGAPAGKKKGVVQAGFLAAHMHGKFFGAASDPLRGNFNAVGQNVTETFPGNHLIDHGDHGFGIAPGQGNTPGIRLADDAVFKAFHGKGQRRSGRYGVQAAAVAHIV